MKIEHVTKLGAREVALIKELSSAVLGSVPDDEIDGVLENRTDFALQFAVHDGRPVGFKIGYRQDRERFYSWLGGVLPEWRKRGIGQALMAAQHEHCRKAGFKVIETRTKNKWRDMLVLNLKSGFDVVGTFTDERREPKIILENERRAPQKGRAELEFEKRLPQDARNEAAARALIKVKR